MAQRFISSFLLAIVCLRVVAADEQLPNFVVIFIDDMGYADIGPFGAEDYETSHLDRLASQGMRLTDFQVSSAVCSASRAALLTGCYHVRVGIHGALFPKSENGISDNEMTIAELLKQKGYATACFGKWHLGHHRKFLPLQHGFDEYYGLPYSNDMWPYPPGFVNLPEAVAERKKNYPELPLLDGNEIVDAEVTPDDQAQLTTDYTKRAVDFIDRNAERPFFLYVPHSMVHVPLFVSEKFAGKSGAGLFGDVVMELDWSVGEIVAALKRNDVGDRTHCSSSRRTTGRGSTMGTTQVRRSHCERAKGTMFEGGCRVPTIAWWPEKIPAGSVHAMSWFQPLICSPPVAALTDTSLPAAQD